MPRPLIKDIEYNGSTYQVQVDGGRVEVVEWVEEPYTAGMVAQLWAELGQPLTRRKWYKVDPALQDEIILSCGRDFSRSKVWRDRYASLRLYYAKD